MSIILENKVISKLILSKNVNNKNVLINWHSAMKKKLRKIRMIFDKENWLWKSDIGTFWQFPAKPIYKIGYFHLVC